MDSRTRTRKRRPRHFGPGPRRPGCDCEPCVQAQIGMMAQNRRFPLVTPLVLASVPPYAKGLFVCRWGRA